MSTWPKGSIGEALNTLGCYETAVHSEEAVRGVEVERVSNAWFYNRRCICMSKRMVSIYG